MPGPVAVPIAQGKILLARKANKATDTKPKAKKSKAKKSKK